MVVLYLVLLYNLFSYVGFNKAGARQAKGNGSAQAGPSSAVQYGDVAVEGGQRSTVQGVSGASQAGPSSSFQGVSARIPTQSSQVNDSEWAIL